MFGKIFGGAPKGDSMEEENKYTGKAGMEEQGTGRVMTPAELEEERKAKDGIPDAWREQP